jgi:hypothetical protein
VGLLDRDWYWERRAKRNAPDDEYLFPERRWPGRRQMVYPTALAILAILALLVFGLYQGWFDRDWRSHEAKLQAEQKALGKWKPDQPPGARFPSADAQRGGRHVDTFYDRHRVAIDIALAGTTLLAPLVLVGMLAGVFIRRLRGPALIGLLVGFVAAGAGATSYRSGSFFRMGLLYPADSMGSAFQFFMVVISCFTIAALASAIAVFVFGRPLSASDAAAVPPPGDGNDPRP